MLATISREPQLKVVGGVDKVGGGPQLLLPDGSSTVPFSSDLKDMLDSVKPQVVVDFSIAEAAMAAVRQATQHKVNMVIGTTGLTPLDLEEIERLSQAHGVGVIAAPNFALGAVVMIHLAKLAAKFFDYAEIIELHHQMKADAPSGTSLSTAKAMVEARGKPFTYPQTAKETIPGTRGGQVEGIAVHSVRLPGLMASQEIIFGAAGQTLSLRHDTFSRECYGPGVVMAIKEVVKRKGFVYGLDKLLGL